ncbi:vitamin K-dependent protein C [Bufo gargarizans]|uniref:vitamin K-dependent protein C n=1 Tax=Bufo gargarizans TaxID=30331 RepID=UPI001CF1A20D|nr:vitamin K-dependent protein C [Bufo gargarizans]
MNRSLYLNILWLVILSAIPLYPTRSIFFSRQDANRVLKIQKRANNLMEELRPGNLERECYEEKCDLEEANEVFETREETLNFWAVYFDGDQCLSNPCAHGTCKDGIGKFDCTCPRGWEGKLCSDEVTHFNCSVNNGGCIHFCKETDNSTSRACSCASGYKLGDDHRSCQPVVEFPCGKMKIFNSNYSARLTGAKKGKKGDSPWQALIVFEKKFHCGGVLIYPSWVISAAHCFRQNGKYFVRLGEFDRRTLEDTEQQIYVTKIITHPQFKVETVDNDIALLRLSQPAVYNKYVLPICLPSYGLAETKLTLEGTETIVTGWGNQDQSLRNRTSILSYIQIPIVPHENCSEVMQNRVTDNMLCAGRLGDRQDACSGDSGGPMVTNFRDTWFLIGLVSWGEGCGRLDNFGIYTKVNNYLQWMHQELTNYEAEEKKMKLRITHSRKP